VGNLIIDNPIAIPSMECILLCDDKYLLNRSLAANGFGHFLPKMGGTLAYPYILKKRIDLSGENSHLISDKQQEQVFSDISTHSEYFSQDFIKGSYEYATHILFKNQRIVHSMNIEYKFTTETPIKGKDKSIYTMICHCPYLDVFAPMLRKSCQALFFLYKAHRLREYLCTLCRMTISIAEPGAALVLEPNQVPQRGHRSLGNVDLLFP